MARSARGGRAQAHDDLAEGGEAAVDAARLRKPPLAALAALPQALAAGEVHQIQLPYE